MGLDGILAVCLGMLLVGGMWKLNRHYERSGVIFAVPFSVRRERAPRFFRLTMILNWFVLALTTVAFVAVVAAMIAYGS